MNAHRTKVLLIEDSPGDVRLIKEMLSEASVQEVDLEWVNRLQIGLDRLGRHDIDIVLLDLGLPDSCGLETIESVHAHSPSIPIVVLTGAVDESLGIAAIHKGSEDYLVKGKVDSNLLLRAIRYAIGRKKAEEALRLSEEKYRNLFHSANDGIFLFELSEQGIPGDILEANRAACLQLGYSREELLRMSYEDICSREGLDEIVREMKESTTDKHRAFETIHKAKDARRIPVELNIHTFILQGRQVALSIARDISDRKLLEEQFLRAQKMETIGRLAGGVAHDFNNILTAITNYGTFLRDSLTTGTQAFQDSEKILISARRGADLVKQLLTFSRKQIIRPEVVDLNHMLFSMKKMLQRLIREDVNLVMRTGDSLKRIRIDPMQFEQIIINLILNAQDAMQSGGTLTVETSNSVLNTEDTHLFGEVVPGDYVMLLVGDTGIGMTESVKSHLFEPFFTTKEIGQGTGLGLAAVYGIVKQHKGQISVVSALGKGTTFRIFFPAMREQTQTYPAVLKQELLPRGTEHILVVEDEVLVRVLMARILRELGYHVIEAQDPQDALTIIQAGITAVDLLLTDVVMPGMNGKLLAEKIRAIRPDIKVLFVSGYSGSTILQHGISGEKENFLPKPFTNASLATKLREVLGNSNVDAPVK